jgi:hypothetical protein
MEQDKIVNAIINLPPEAQRQIADFIDFLQIRYKTDHKDLKSDCIRFADEPFIGMWKNKKELKDSTGWVRKLRKSEWGGDGDTQ